MSVLSDAEIIELVRAKHVPAYKLEATTGDNERAVSIRSVSSSDDVTKLYFLLLDILQ